MQNYNRIYNYFEDYWKLLYDYYSNHGQAYLVTYYNIDKDNTVWDDENLMGGYYEKIGSLSGVKWKKILTFPVYFIGETDTIFDATEAGLINDGKTEFVIPSSYGITPYANDMILLYQNYLQEEQTHALFVVTGIQKQSPGDRTYWKCNCNIEQSRLSTELDLQVSENLVFFDYDKKIHSVSDSIIMTKLLSKNESIKSNLTEFFDNNSGLYYI